MKKLLLLITVFAMLLSSVACGTKTDVTESNGTNSSASNENEASNEPENNSSDGNENASSESIAPSESTVPSEPDDIPSESDNEISQKNISDIPVIVKGVDKLNLNGYKINGDFSFNVSVTVKGTNTALSEIDADDIVASIDVSNIKEEGNIQCVIDFVAPEGVSITSRSDSIATISVKKVSAEIVPPEVDDVRIVEGVLISGTRAMEQFYGKASGGANTAATLNDFKKQMGDVNVYALPAPLASAFYAPVGYEISISRHQECFYGMRDALVDVGFVDTLSALSAHVDKDLYFRTDHHWQALAAYYASEKFASVAGVPFDSLSTFSVKSEDGVLGSFYTTYTKDAVLKNNPDTMVWYEPTRQHSVEYYSRNDISGSPITDRTLFSTNSGYTKFIYGDSYTTHITSNVGNGRKLLLFKDSYGNALVPFLVGSFDEIYVADYRYFESDVSDFIEEQGITDVCFSIAAFGVNSFKGLNINY